MKLVNIGVPVLNEERFLSQTLDSLLAQDYSNLEIIICDNASTDKTEEIARKYTEKYNRIKYFKNKEQVSGPENWNRVFQLTSSEYFMWVSGHDLYDKSYISSCVEILEKERDVVLTYSLTYSIDNHGNKLQIVPQYLDTRGLSLISRFNKFILASNNSSCILTGLIRSELIKKTHLMQSILAADTLFLSELSLLGYFAQIQKPLYYRREIRHETPIITAKRRIKDIFINKRKYPAIFYLFHLIYKYLTTIWQSSINFNYKTALSFFVFYDLGILYFKTMLKYIKK